jgi:pimeloyl-ACP methyl ester carboxylesterase
VEKEEEDIFPDPMSAPTLAYDSEVMGDIGRDGTVPVDQARRVTVPALVLTGGADYPWMIDVGRRLADAMPNGRHRVLEDQEHVVSPEVLVPVLEGFFSDSPGRESEPTAKPL